MIKRLLTSFVGLIVFFLILFSPYNKLFVAAVLGVTLIAIYEIHNAVCKKKSLLIVGFLMSILVFVANLTKNLESGLLILLAVYLLMSVIEFGKTEVKIVYMLGFATAIYSTFISTVAIIKIEYTVIATLLLFVISWITDAGAYFVGCSIGKHKLIPHLSPKKTVEGAVGGIIACVLLSLLYVFILDKIGLSIFGGNDYLKILIVSLVGSVISQLGDFASSAIKREFNVKDFGKLLPGHGGVLDRFDSIIFVAPFVYYILKFMA